MQLSDVYWNQRCSESDTGWDAGEITAPLRTYIDGLKDKDISILIPGAGNAYEAEYLFSLGFKNVFVLDFAKEALDNFLRRCPDFPEENLIALDFFQHRGQYDLILEQTFFCAIDPKLRPDYAKHMHSLLKSGGRLAGVLFNDKLNADKPPFGGTKEEYLAYFEPLFRIKTLEPCYNSIKPRAGRELFIHLVKD